MQPKTQLCPECGHLMEYRLGGFECPSCGRMLLPPSLEPEPPPTSAAAAPAAFIQAAAAHAAQPDAPLLPPLPPDTATELAYPPGFPYPAPPTSPTPPAAPAAYLDENTSGQGATAPLPPAAQGTTMGSILPFGLFSFFTGDPLWGVIGLVGTFLFIPGLVYWAYVSFEGKKIAWRKRRFASVAQYRQVMDAWNIAGLVFTLVVGLAAIGIASYCAKAAEAYFNQSLGLN